MEPIKKELHPRNRHKGLYDFKALIKDCPELARFVEKNKHGNESIEFANPQAVKTLNKALLKHFYNIIWNLPGEYLCPPIPSRADYIHYLADLLEGVKGESVKVLDIGVGANCIYPLIGHREYGWSFVGTDIDEKSVSIARKNIEQNGFEEFIEVRQQENPKSIFKGVLRENEVFDVSMCNPPFHSSQKMAQEGTCRKWRNLKIKTRDLNFGGQSNELWCEGGELAFIKRMVVESIRVKCKWFTTLVSKSSNLPSIYKALDVTNPKEVRIIEMGQGQKKSRIVAWSYLSPNKK
jgi:23S rRNA (adenine1618-N6)-methyltransferase